MEPDYDEKISFFLLEYVKPRKEGYTADGNLTPTAIKASVQLLLNEKVFASKKDMRTQAMKDYKIILPEEIFDDFGGAGDGKTDTN